jgi:hypothetical protein
VKRTAFVLASLSLAAVLGAVGSVRPAAAAQPAANPVPLLAYYYIWYSPASWRRAKTDYPVLGPYSSNDIRVVKQHVTWARKAGVNGFIVSWKATERLNRPLAHLIAAADEQNFKLVLIYQGLDFERNPLPAARVAHDLRLFADRYAADPAFDLFAKPLVIWSGTWKFSRAEVASVTRSLRSKLLILASEKDKAGYERLADLVDGDAYYWSSVNPDTFPGYPAKLQAMSSAIHARHGLWIAPAAPGFDARLVGGTRIVPRKNGETLRKEMDAAIQSSPDAVGLISWNEFSENSQVEPSVRFGRRYLDVLTDMQRPQGSIGTDFDSSQPVTGIGYGLPILSGLAGVVFAALLMAFTRRHIRRGRASMWPPKTHRRTQ